MAASGFGCTPAEAPKILFIQSIKVEAEARLEDLRGISQFHAVVLPGGLTRSVVARAATRRVRLFCSK